jgi:ABC-2 type transport system permease protein
VSISRAVAIARANLTRLLRDRLGLFFIVILPIIIIFAIGAQFGGGFASRVGLLGEAEAGSFTEDLADRLGESWTVDVVDSEEKLRQDVRSGRYNAGILLRDDYDERIAAGDEVAIDFVAPAGDFSFSRQQVLEAAVAQQAALVRAARFAADEVGGGGAGDYIQTARSLQNALPPVDVQIVTVGEELFPEELAGFALGAQSQLVLFTFLTSLTGAAQLILSRQLGVSRRMLSTPTPIGTILSGEALGRLAVALFQALFIVAATALIFGVTWGDPLGVALIVIVFSMVGAGIAMLVGAVAGNAEQASSVGVFVGLGIGAIGGSMVPPEIFPEPMATISWLTPHRWALDGFRELIAGGGAADVLPQVGVLLTAAVVLLAVGTWRLRLALTA